MTALRGLIAEGSAATQVPEPPIARFLFADTRLAWFWLAVRVYVGWQWVEAGYEKLVNPAWVGANAGAGLTGFVNGALGKTGGDHPDVIGWYAGFLQAVVLPYAATWSYAITLGEILVGLGLIFGCLTGVAAFFGSFMNANFLFAGTVSVNPLLFVLATWLVLAWRVAGFIGLDFFVLPMLGTPWALGKLTRHPAPTPKPVAVAGGAE
ncbi:MAG: DoxX family membrane protein [Chloroflexi bacterium]|nr:DoxX family membrane protein [Chloroflexota bacterium]